MGYTFQADKAGDQEIVGLMDDDHGYPNEENWKPRENRTDVDHLARQTSAGIFKTVGKIIETDKHQDEKKVNVFATREQDQDSFGSKPGDDQDENEEQHLEIVARFPLCRFAETHRTAGTPAKIQNEWQRRRT